MLRPAASYRRLLPLPVALPAAEFSLAYGGKILLNNARLHLKRGQRYGLCGPNGSGKSTLMRAIGESTPPPPLFRCSFVCAALPCCCTGVPAEHALACLQRWSVMLKLPRLTPLRLLHRGAHVPPSLPSPLPSPAANGQLDGFPPKTELRTVYVEHDIDASGEPAPPCCTSVGLCCVIPVEMLLLRACTTQPRALPAPAHTPAPPASALPPPLLQRPRPPWLSLW